MQIPKNWNCRGLVLVLVPSPSIDRKDFMAKELRWMAKYLGIPVQPLNPKTHDSH
jgi:hypothetical protein